MVDDDPPSPGFDEQVDPAVEHLTIVLDEPLVVASTAISPKVTARVSFVSGSLGLLYVHLCPGLGSRSSPRERGIPFLDGVSLRDGGTRITSRNVTLPEHWCHLVRIGEDPHVGSTDTDQPIVAGLNRAINAG